MGKVELFINKYSKGRQFVLSITLVCLISLICFFLSSHIGYKVIALILLLTVSLLAVVFDILPVLTAAILSALIWNYFFIPPHYTFRINTTEDGILFIMYFIIALVNAVLTYKIRQLDKIARQREERANTVKLYNTLLNSLSHELRTPIATVIAATDNLLANNTKLTNQNKYELISEIAKAAFRLDQQVDNLLSMSRIEAGFIQPKRDWCDINEIVYDAVKRIEEAKATQKIHISIPPMLPLFKLDKGMLEQIIYNLLNNAVQYIPQGSSVTISARNHADILELIVEDNGPGFPENEIDHVFEKFYRLKNSAAGGTGLGLSIVKGFTEAQGGQIALKNLPEGGAKFTMVFTAPVSHLKSAHEKS